MADLNTLKTDAGTIRDASQQNENTAFRIGSWLVDLIEFLTNTTIEAVMTSIIPSVTADGIVLTINYQKADGTTFANSITLPLADAEKPGLMSPTMVAKISSLQSSINAINTKNAEQDNSISALSSNISTLQSNAVKDRQDFEAKDTEHDNAIEQIRQNLSNHQTLVEQAKYDSETAVGLSRQNASLIADIRQEISSHGSDISTLQSNAVKARQDFEAKDTEHDNAIEQIKTQLESQNEINLSFESHLRDFEEDVIGANQNDGNGALFPRVIKLEKDFSEWRNELATNLLNLKDRLEALENASNNN